MSQSEVVPREVTQQRLNRGYALIAGYRRDQAYSVADMLEERAADAGGLPFMLFEGRALTFAQLNAGANRIAHAALGLGLRSGAVVALMMDNCPEFPMVWLGLAKVGIVTALLNTAARGRILRHALEQTAARALVYGPECADRVASLGAADLPAIVLEFAQPEGVPAAPAVAGSASLNAVMAAASPLNPQRAHRAQVRLQEPLYLIFTSGTTGLPKAARMSHLRFLNAGGVIAGLLELRRGDVFYNVLPLYHGAGGMVVVSVALHLGIPIVQRRRFSASEFWNDVRAHRVTAWYYIGELCRYLLNQPPRADDREHTLRRMSGAGLKAEVWREFAQRFGIERICEGLGSTEANYGLTNVDNKIGSVGRLPYPERSNIRVVRYDVDAQTYPRTSDGAVAVCSPGEVGELIAEILDGPTAAGFFEGYTSAEATEAKILRNVFRPGDRWMRSGDLVRHDEDDYYYFVDRVGDTYRWKGENVSTDEVAAALARFPGPAVVNVYGVRVDGAEGRAGMVALTYTEPALFEPGAFHEFAAARLADYAVPLFVRISREADLTTTFKLRKIDLQRAGYDPARTDDALYVRDARAGTYLPVSAASLAALNIAPFAGGLAVHVEYTEAQQALRREFRAYLARLMTPEARAATRDRESGPAFRALLKHMGADGWLTPGWPQEYGGRGLDPLAQKIVLEELWLAAAPFPFVTVNTIGPALMRRGTAAQKRQILPRIASGELNFAVGYTEPQAGTDLAALRTQAVRDGDFFVINGQKVFTSGAEGADYVWLAARTDANAGHRGISIIMVDTSLPGFALTPIHTVGGIRTNVTFYKDVRVPAAMLVGELNGGWQLITEQLNHERVGLAALAYGAQACFDDTLVWARSTVLAGGRVIDQPWVQSAFAECYALLQAYAVLGNRVAWEVAQGEARAQLASACKVFSTETYIRVVRLLLEVTGPPGLLQPGSPGAILQGRLENEYRRCQINTFGGGATEVLRDMVAQVGLGLPRAGAR